jgi:hypothetical protein
MALVVYTGAGAVVDDDDIEVAERKVEHKFVGLVRTREATRRTVYHRKRE